MEKEEKSLSILVLLSFLLLFFVFMFLKGDEAVQSDQPTTALIFLDVVKGDTLFNTIIEIVLLAAILGLIFFVIKYFKKKNKAKIQTQPTNTTEMSEQQIESVFSTPLSYPMEKSPYPRIQTQPVTEEQEPLEEQVEEPEEQVEEIKGVKIDDRILNFIKTALLKGYTKEQIKRALIDKNWPLGMIEAALAKS